MHELDKTIESLAQLMSHAWDVISEQDRASLAHAYTLALIRRIADKGRERS
jgi:hypothetical protein